MKNLKNLKWAMLLAAAGVAFASCSEDDDASPSIVITAVYGDPADTHILTDGGEIVADVGTMVALSVRYVAGQNNLSGAKLDMKFGEDVWVEVMDSTLNEGVFNTGVKELVIPYIANIPGGGNELLLRFSAIARGRAGAETTAQISLKAKPEPDPVPLPDPTFALLAPVTLHGQSSVAGGSFWSFARNDMTWNFANASQASIDFIYFNLGASGATLAAPSRWTTTSVTPMSNIAGWSVKNATRLALLDGVDRNAPAGWWDAEVVNGTFTSIEVNNLRVNDVVAYHTVAANGSLKGALVITEITGTTAGTITFQIIEKVAE